MAFLPKKALADFDPDQIANDLKSDDKAKRLEAVMLLNSIKPEFNEIISRALVFDYPKKFSGRQPFRGLAQENEQNVGSWKKHVPNLVDSFANANLNGGTTATLFDVLLIHPTLNESYDPTLHKIFSFRPEDSLVAYLIQVRYPHLAENVYLVALENYIQEDKVPWGATHEMMRKFGTSKSLEVLRTCLTKLENRGARASLEEIIEAIENRTEESRAP